MNKTRIKNEFTIKKCTIEGIGEYGRIFSAECKASIESRSHEKTLRTKSGSEYVVAQKEYALIIGKNVKTDAVFDVFENVESYRATFSFPDSYKKDDDYVIEDIAPERIDLDGDWVFKISDEEVEKLFDLHEAHR